MGAVAPLAVGLLASDGAVTTVGQVKPAAGQVLTAIDDETAEWDDPAGGGGVQQVLDAHNVVLPDTNFPSIGKTVGSNWLYRTLDFDPSTDEAGYWTMQIPTWLATITAAKLTLYWTASSGTAAQLAYWEVVTRSVNNDEVIDALTTPDDAIDTGNDALIATNDLHKLEIALTTTGWAAGDMLQIKLFRDANHASDNLSGDAKLIAAVLEIT